jgi:serine protease Do
MPARAPVRTAPPAAPRRILAFALAFALAAPVGLTGTFPAFARGAPESFADLSAELSPAVVNITTSTNAVQVDSRDRPVVPEGSPFEDFFRDFLDRQPGGPEGPAPRQRRSSALGSGFIISADGYIVTNNHVIEAADEVEIELFDGNKKLKAEIVGRDPRTDLALLKVESDTPLPFVPFGNSDAMRVGDWVLAIGNPLGQGFSVSAGIVSARNRTLQGSYDDFIQTDAAINRGNSGGPLFNMNGEVIGVNTAILSPTGGSIGIGFAMSSAVVERVVAQLRDFGETRRGWLGVRIQNVDPDMADALGLAAPVGALVTDVPEGPALDAGMKAGDVIMSFDGDLIEDTRELVRVVAETEVGRSVEIVVFRDGAETALSVHIGRLEEAVLAAAPGVPGEPEVEATEQVVLGMTVAAVDEALRTRFGLAEDARGLVVVAVDESSDAYAKGMRDGDLITEVGREAIATPREMERRIEAAESAGRKSLLLLVRRGDAPRFVALSLTN